MVVNISWKQNISAGKQGELASKLRLKKYSCMDIVSCLDDTTDAMLHIEA
jgi:hypothetical protein